MDYRGIIKPYNQSKMSKAVKVLLKGLSKTGKTYLMSTFPKPFVIDTDHSLNGMRDLSIPTYSISISDVRAGKINVYETIFDILLQIRDKKPPFSDVETLCIDGLTSLAEMMILEAMLDVRIGKTRRDPALDKATFDEYGVLENRLLCTLMPMVADLGINFCATAGLKLDEEESQGSKAVLPDIKGGTRQRIEYKFDAVIYTTCDRGKYFANCVGTFKIPAGIRRWCGPEKIENPTFEKIFNEKNFISK